jgi:hypothetical protein
VDLVEIKIKAGDLFEIKEYEDKGSKKKILERWEGTEIKRESFKVRRKLQCYEMKEKAGEI